MADRVFVVKVSESKIRLRPDGIAVVISDDVVANHTLERAGAEHDYALTIRNGAGPGSIGSDLVVDYLRPLNVTTRESAAGVARDARPGAQPSKSSGT